MRTSGKRDLRSHFRVRMVELKSQGELRNTIVKYTGICHYLIQIVVFPAYDLC